jgi:hypothetical protein
MGCCMTLSFTFKGINGPKSNPLKIACKIENLILAVKAVNAMGMYIRFAYTWIVPPVKYTRIETRIVSMNEIDIRSFFCLSKM